MTFVESAPLLTRADFIGSMNMLEGRLVVDEPDHAEVAVPGLTLSRKMYPV